MLVISNSDERTDFLPLDRWRNCSLEKLIKQVSDWARSELSPSPFFFQRNTLAPSEHGFSLSLHIVCLAPAHVHTVPLAGRSFQPVSGNSHEPASISGPSSNHAFTKNLPRWCWPLFSFLLTLGGRKSQRLEGEHRTQTVSFLSSVT